MLKLKLQYLGHLMWRTDSLEKILMLGKTEGGKRRGWQRMRRLNGITDSMDVILSNLWKIVKDREAWRVAIHGIAKTWTWLSNWTETKMPGNVCTCPPARISAVWLWGGLGWVWDSLLGMPTGIRHLSDFSYFHWGQVADSFCSMFCLLTLCPGSPFALPLGEGLSVASGPLAAAACPSGCEPGGGGSFCCDASVFDRHSIWGCGVCSSQAHGDPSPERNSRALPRLRVTISSQSAGTSPVLVLKTPCLSKVNWN